jgi:hypothetical protein
MKWEISNDDFSIRSIIAVLGGIGLFALVTETLEFALVTAAAGGSISDMPEYFAVRNRPVILAAKLLYNTMAAILAGYITAKVAGRRERFHAAVVAIVQTIALVWGFTAGEYASFTPAWMRVALVLTTGPAMMLGAAIRARATNH